MVGLQSFLMQNGKKPFYLENCHCSRFDACHDYDLFLKSVLPLLEICPNFRKFVQEESNDQKKGHWSCSEAENSKIVSTLITFVSSSFFLNFHHPLRLVVINFPPLWDYLPSVFSSRRPVRLLCKKVNECSFKSELRMPNLQTKYILVGLLS